LAAIVALSGCSIGFGGPKERVVTETVIQFKRELCPVEIEEPTCPDFAPFAGRPHEVIIAERDLVYQECRGWAAVVWKARQDCETDDD